MVAKSTQSRPANHQTWRSVIVCLLIILGIVSLIIFTTAHWTERQILTTDNWLKIVGPLPKNDAVATSLSEYSVNQLLKTIDLEAKITQALPDRASFLAPPLTEQVETRLTKRTKQLIQSDQFSSIWISANHLAHQRLINSARGQTAPPKTNARFNLNLSSIKKSINAQLGTSSASSKDDVSLGVNLKTSVEKLKSLIRAVDFLNGTTGLLALVSLLGGVVLTFARRRLIMVISIAVMVMALLQLIGVKALRPAILNSIENKSYQPAGGVIYDTLLSNYRRAATATLFIGLIIYLLTVFTRPRVINRSAYLAKQLAQYKKTSIYRQFVSFRLFVRRSLLAITGLVVLLGLAFMAFIANLDWQGIIRSALLTLLVIELINLVAARPRSLPMKQTV